MGLDLFALRKLPLYRLLLITFWWANIAQHGFFTGTEFKKMLSCVFERQAVIGITWLAIGRNEGIILPKTDGADISTVFVCGDGISEISAAGTLIFFHWHPSILYK